MIYGRDRKRDELQKVKRQLTKSQKMVFSTRSELKKEKLKGKPKEPEMAQSPKS